jgi:hypothetical protein
MATAHPLFDVLDGSFDTYRTGMPRSKALRDRKAI